MTFNIYDWHIDRTLFSCVETPLCPFGVTLLLMKCYKQSQYAKKIK